MSRPGFDCYINLIYGVNMNCLRCKKTAILLVILITFVGCKSKQEKPVTGSGTPQEKTAAPVTIPPQDKPVAPVVTAQDKTDAQAAAVRVLGLLESGDFPAIYKDSAAGFK